MSGYKAKDTNELFIQKPTCQGESVACCQRCQPLRNSCLHRPESQSALGWAGQIPEESPDICLEYPCLRTFVCHVFWQKCYKPVLVFVMHNTFSFPPQGYMAQHIPPLADSVRLGMLTNELQCRHSCSDMVHAFPKNVIFCKHTGHMKKKRDGAGHSVLYTFVTRALKKTVTILIRY